MIKSLKLLTLLMLGTQALFGNSPFKGGHITEMFVEILQKHAEIQTAMVNTYENSSFGKFERSPFAQWYRALTGVTAAASLSLFSYAYAKKARMLMNKTMLGTKQDASHVDVAWQEQEAADNAHCAQLLSDAQKIGFAATALMLAVYVIKKKYELDCAFAVTPLQNELEELWKKINILTRFAHA